MDDTRRCLCLYLCVCVNLAYILLHLLSFVHIEILTSSITPIIATSLFLAISSGIPALATTFFLHTKLFLLIIYEYAYLIFRLILFLFQILYIVIPFYLNFSSSGIWSTRIRFTAWRHQSLIKSKNIFDHIWG